MSVPRVLGSVVVLGRSCGARCVRTLLVVLLVVLLLVHVVLVRRVAAVHRVLQRLGVTVEVTLVPVGVRPRAGACVTGHARTLTARRTLG